ncbi:MAG: FAD-dependent oxidoreductase, partial [Candidatus Obscuribacterales bacterium]|nr:FAD-dependent oxidoreductase [Candidatus Obscuribacterales bacterium]
MMSIAIIGSGISGLGAAYFLHKNYSITIYEKNAYVGGHSNTVTVDEEGKAVAIDTGFMVFNKVTYPNLIRLFDKLSVPIKQTDMSFSAQNCAEGIEFAGASFDRLFGQRKNLFSLRYWRMLMQLNRFNNEANAALSDSNLGNLTLSDYVKQRGYGQDFLNWYLVPMSSALWSAPPEKILSFPALSLLRFFHNHGFLGMDTQHQWWTLVDGAKSYVSRLLSLLDQHIIRLQDKVLSVKREESKVRIFSEDGSSKTFDKAIFACHADQALAALEDADQLERSLLSAFQYQNNIATLHTDSSVMPKSRGCWASWNYRLDNNKTQANSASTHYWMNSLQQVSKKTDYFVSINGEHLIK